ncbi:MAG: anthranilate phosphoribosyltransferase [Acidobacteriota bacterium]|nr:anthranilate phosphoribosyltransferase [Acidobacteriota bacterium]
MKDILASVLGGQILSEQEAGSALRMMLSGKIPTAQAAAFLAAITMRGIWLEELRGFHAVLREIGIKVDFSDLSPIDVCGTGGDGKHTFNISTVSAFVLAGAGVRVAKHGNSSATSGCGSSDVLKFLGCEFTNDTSVLRQQLEEVNFCYLHAPLFQPALKQVAPLRAEIGFRTFFNLLGPLLNPAAPPFQFIGVAEPAILRLYRYFLETTPTSFALVHTRDGYDEISLTAAFDVVTNDGAETFYAEDLGFETVRAEELRGGEAIEEAACQFLNILQGQGSRAQNQTVIANAAFAMQIAKPQMSFEECKDRATESLQSGAAFQCFSKLINNRRDAETQRNIF